MKKFFAIILTLITTSAFAVGIGNDNPPSGGGTTEVTNTNLNTNFNNVTVKPVIDSSSRARAEAWAASQSKSQSTSISYSQGGDSKSTATGGTGIAYNAGSQSGVGITMEIPRNTPAIALGALYPTAPCMGTSNIGGSGVGFGFGFGTSWTDDECGIRETARSFNGLGLKDDAVSVLCTSKYAVAAPVCNINKEKSE